MSKIKSAIATAKRLVVGESVHEALTRRRREATQEWRALVQAAAEGREVDIDRLSLAGGLIGVGVTKVAAVFESDRKTWFEQQDLAKSAANAAANAEAVAKKAAAAREQLDQARATFERLQQEANADGWAYAGAGIAESHALTHRRANPRLWPSDSLLSPADMAEAASVPDEPEPDQGEPVPAGSARADGDAFWESDN